MPKLNCGAALGEMRETSKMYMVIGVEGYLTNYHPIPDGKGGYLIGDRVTKETATHIGTSYFKVEEV